MICVGHSPATAALYAVTMEMAFTALTRGRVRLVICLHTSVDPPAAEWETMMRELTALLTAASDNGKVRMLLVTGGGAPDVTQRAMLGKVWGGRDVRVAVLIPGYGNALKRGLMTALTWINPATAFFTPEELKKALEHLEQAEDLPELWKQLAGLQRQLAEVTTLQRIARAHALPTPKA